jgi:TfoX/Sxy family transcriptional regulator of competence genes
MAYDEQLAQRVRTQLAGEAGLTEKRMFGGLAFLIGGNMAVAVSHRGGLMLRTDPTTSDELVAATNARTIEMRGRPMPGWLHVKASDLRTEPQLARWLERSTSYTRSLPAKK